MSHAAKAAPDLIVRVRKIAGQVAAIERELVGDADCDTVLHRVAAVRGAVNGLMDEIIADHLATHVARPGLSDADRARGADELLAVIRRYGK